MLQLLKRQKVIIQRISNGCGTNKCLCTLVGSVKWYQRFGKKYSLYYKVENTYKVQIGSFTPRPIIPQVNPGSRVPGVTQHVHSSLAETAKLWKHSESPCTGVWGNTSRPWKWTTSSMWLNLRNLILNKKNKSQKHTNDMILLM